MKKRIELKIEDAKEIYKEIVQVLYPHRYAKAGSIIFVVEGNKDKPIIGLRYPGRKLRKRELKRVNVNSAHWANLYDFEVIAYNNGKEIENQKFTFQEFLRDFQENKKNNKEFWNQIVELYENNTISKIPPKLPGIDTMLFLQMLKWIWIQEDFNYRLDWEDVKSPEKYVLENRTGTRTAKGAGRAKFYAGLMLLKQGFDFDQVKKIIPLY